MFERNDRVLIKARIAVIAVIAILAGFSLVNGILLAIELGGIYILCTLIGWFFCSWLWLFFKLYLSYLCDIKLIRNKLYGESNEGLEVFLKAPKERSNNPEMQEEKAVNSECNYLERLVNPDAIVADEYNKTNRKAITSAVYTVESNKAIAESLKLYKDLFDSGVITQEEFEKLKGDILK